MFTSKEVPWPKIGTISGEIPMKRRYALRDMSYLDTLEARPIFEKQADIIIKNNYKGIVDIGCRHGPVNDFLHEKNYKDYQYYGFDTSPEPIEYAQKRWPNYQYEVRDWANLKKVNFKVDCIIFSGVLLYEKDHYKMFTDIMSFYNCKNAVIQEPYHEQKYYEERLKLKSITNDMQQYKFKEKTIVEAEIFCGRRLVGEVEYE
jgi:trans-aconitate methyltransferase